MARFKKPLLYLLSFQLCFTGFLHLINPGFFVAIIPPELPEPEWLNLISGLIEIVLGVYLLEPRTRVFAAWGTIALLIAVYPANTYMLMENLGPEGPGTSRTCTLPLRPCCASTRPSHRSGGTAAST